MNCDSDSDSDTDDAPDEHIIIANKSSALPKLDPEALKIKLSFTNPITDSHREIFFFFFFFFFFFQIYLYRVNHSVTLFFHGALLQSKIYRYKEHIYTHP